MERKERKPKEAKWAGPDHEIVILVRLWQGVWNLSSER